MTNTTWERLVDHQDLKSIKKFRALPYLVKNIYASSLEDAKNDGWEFLSKIKNSNKIKIKKTNHKTKSSRMMCGCFFMI